MAVQVAEKPAEKQGTLIGHTNGIPPLQAGDFLTRVEFERRYHAHPEIKKAELIEGVVYMPSPVRVEQHGDPHFDIIGWLALYRSFTYGIKGSDNATLRLDNLNEPQPDAMLRLDLALGGSSRVAEDDYLEGGPEFIVEIAASSSSYDMNQKKNVYLRHGVQEYLVVQIYEKKIVWFALHAGRYEEIEPGEDNILRSEIFPGLWLDPAAFWRNDMATVMTVLQAGMASPEYAAFVTQLKGRG